MPAKGGLGRAIKYLGHYKRLTAAAYLFLFISTAAQLAVPQLVQNIIDAVTNGVIAKQLAQTPAAFLSTALQRLGWTPEQLDTYRNSGEQVLVNAIVLIVAFAIMRGMFAFAQAYTSERVSQSIAFDFRNDLYAKIQRLSFSYHDRNQTGQLMIRATDDVEKVRLFIGQGLLLAMQAFVLLTATLTILVVTNLKLTLIILPVLPVALLLFMVFGAISQPLFSEVQKRLSRLNTILQENLTGIKVVKAFAREPHEERKFDVAAASLMEQNIKVSRTFAFLFPVVFLIANLGQAAVLYYGGKQIIDGTLTFGEWQKFSLYLVYVFFPIGQLGFIISQMSQASASSSRIFEIFDARNDVADKPGATALPPVQGHVTFEDVTFRYFDSGEPVLSQVSFDAKPGETIALLGATGSGKTTIINLLPRFYDISSGHVRIDGHDVREVTLDSLRSQIGIVLQETNLFSGTIRENIAFGRPEASLAEVTAAAKAASAHDFIMSFSADYETPVGERGSTLSGGQKQRIAIARALLLNPRILILDDSTSSVDLQTEFQIQQALTRLMHGRTSFVIAQRISTVVNADQILVMEKGRIVARGKHEDLMDNSPIYADIYHSQLVSDVALTEE
ncbi:MAG: ABC transporter ATP-binding protein [Anaerolineae bacterium]|nr:ABC transporter ATP-binding protein [Anaerolineae bacterium]MBK9229373.1 ABC transporter ATP-binding protein [Anaerolineae bacterium]